VEVSSGGLEGQVEQHGSPTRHYFVLPPVTNRHASKVRVWLTAGES